MKIAAIVTALAVLLLAPLGAATITFHENPAINPSAPLTPGSVSALLDSWLVTAPGSEGIEINSLQVNVALIDMTLQNLSLRVNGALLGFIYINPGPVDFFTFTLIIPAGFTSDLELFADIPFPGNGAVQISVPAGGLAGFGTTSLAKYASLDAVIGGVHVSGTGSATPEPETLVLMGIGLCILSQLRPRLRRRQQKN